MFKPLQIVDPVLLNLPGFRPLELVQLSDGRGTPGWFAIKACGFETEIAAREEGKRFGAALLLAGAIEQVGIDMGFDRSDMTFFEGFRSATKRSTGRELLADVHGLMTFEQDTVAIAWQEMMFRVTLSVEGFQGRLATWLNYSRVTDRQRICAALLNDSFFATSGESQFILRISAVEALCAQDELPAEYQEAIKRLSEHLSQLSLSSEVRGTISQWLRSRGMVSVNAALRQKFSSALPGEWQNFSKLYSCRSRLLHDGLGRGQLREEAAEALRIGIAILKADLSAAPLPRS